MVDAIGIIGWRSDEGAFLVDSYPENIEIDGQDLLNLFSLHRMAVNGQMDKAGPDFNYLRLSEGMTMVSWYSGFRTTQYLARPNFCVTLILEQGENPNAWEEQLRVICYNVLTKLEDDDFISYLSQVLADINDGYLIEPFEGYIPEGEIEANMDNSSVSPTPIPPNTLSNQPNNQPTTPPLLDDDFSELLALAEEQASETYENNSVIGNSNNNQDGDPFASSVDPFGSNGKQEDPFAGDPFKESSSIETTTQSFSSPTLNSSANIPKTPISSEPAPETAMIIQELKNLDRTMPQKPAAVNDRNAQFNYLEKKVSFLEAKIGVFGKLIRALQTKEIEVNEKNQLIAKLLALLS